jgi:hypothetical protein
MLTKEYLVGGEITLKSDIYSLEVLSMQAVTGCHSQKKVVTG